MLRRFPALEAAPVGAAAILTFAATKNQMPLPPHGGESAFRQKKLKVIVAMELQQIHGIAKTFSGRVRPLAKLFLMFPAEPGKRVPHRARQPGALPTAEGRP